MTATVLVVEDEPAIADSVAYALRSEGFTVRCCATAAAGLQAVASGGIDLLVLDVGLPDGNGFDLCRRIRAAHQLPILFLTARADEVDRVVGLELGADDYVVKPFSPRELAARVRAILRRSTAGGAADPLLRVGDFLLDEPRRRLCFHDVELVLSRTEFRILALLLRRPGRVYSRNELLDHAWDEPDSSFERTVDSHIKALRAKLRAVAPEESPIITHRGEGYALAEPD